MFTEHDTEGIRPSFPGEGKQVLLNTQYGQEKQRGKHIKLQHDNDTSELDMQVTE